MTPPKLQREAALAAANRIRLDRAADKRRISAIEPDLALSQVADRLVSVPGHWRSAELGDLLTLPAGVGQVTVNWWLDRVGIRRYQQATTLIGDLTVRERAALRKVILDWSRVRVQA